MVLTQHKKAVMMDSVRALLMGVGEDPEREGLLDTPKRVAKALMDASQGYRQDTESVLGTALFHEPIVAQGNAGVVIVRDIDFASTSEECLLPFFGRCHVAYVPVNGVVLGLSKLARLAKQYAKRLQTQQRFGLEVAAALQLHLQCNGVAVVVEAKHLLPAVVAPMEQTTACVSGRFALENSTELEELLTVLGIDESALHSFSKLPQGAPRGAPLMPRVGTATASMASLDSSSTGSVAAPCTPDLSEKDASDGDSDDVVMAEGASSGNSVGGASPGSATDDDAELGVEGHAGSSAAGAGGSQVVAGEAAAMEAAVQQLIIEMGENPLRQGLQGSARRYVQSLLASTSGYHQKLESIQAAGPVSASSSCPQQAGASAAASTSAASGQKCTCCAPQQQQRGDFAGLPSTSSTDTFFGCGLSASSSSGLVQASFRFASQCEHHMLPFYGNLHVAYLPRRASGAGQEAVQPAVSHRDLEYIVRMYTRRLQVQERITHQVADAVAQAGGADVEGVMVVVDAAHMCMVSRGVENHCGRTTTSAVRGVLAEQPALRKEVLGACRANGVCK